MDRYDIEENRWIELEATLKEGRYHATACIFKNRYIYVFGGYKTEAFYGNVTYKVNRKHEHLSNVRSDYIEVYDTEYDREYRCDSSDEESISKDGRYEFKQIQLKRDNINNVGNLICFPLHIGGEESEEILITGGLFVGIIDVKGHIYNTRNNKINVRKDLALPCPDISKFYYMTPQDKIYVVGRYRVQEFDLNTQKWRLCGLGYVQFCEQTWNF